LYYWRNEVNYWQARSIARPLCDSRASFPVSLHSYRVTDKDDQKPGNKLKDHKKKWIPSELADKPEHQEQGRGLSSITDTSVEENVSLTGTRQKWSTGRHNERPSESKRRCGLRRPRRAWISRDAGSCHLRHTWDQLISASRASSSCKQSTRRKQDVPCGRLSRLSVSFFDCTLNTCLSYRQLRTWRISLHVSTHNDDNDDESL